MDKKERDLIIKAQEHLKAAITEAKDQPHSTEAIYLRGLSKALMTFFDIPLAVED